MKKLPLILGLVAGGIALLLLSLFIVLAVKGKLNNQTLTHMPILGPLFGSPAPILVVDPNLEGPKEKEAAVKAPKDNLPTLAIYEIPAPFTAKELSELSTQLEESRERNEKLHTELKKKEDELNTREQDLETRWTELNTLAGKIDDARKKLDEDLKNYQRNRSDFEAEEAGNIATIASWYGAMTDVTKVADLIVKSHTAEKASRILEEISKEDAEKSGAILAALKPDFVAEIMSITMKRKKSVANASTQ